MQRRRNGWFECVDARSQAGTRYWYEIDEKLRVPDPAARFMPEGPHAPSEVIDPATFNWPENGTDCMRPQRELIFYELHVGTFTPEGTYAAAAAHLHELVELGITAIELMPLAQPAGLRNWGYDGVGLYAPAHAYGRPDELKAFVARAHALGLCVFLDVVYNHFGPEGNYLHAYAPQFFDERRETPWGPAIDYESPQNRAVRDYAIDNACYWLYEYRIDGLRLDAIDEIESSANAGLVCELSDAARAAAGRPVFLIAETDREAVACDAQWNDAVHHCLHVATTGEADGYYERYCDSPTTILGDALTSECPERFVTFLQNHDQIGNRPLGERIAALAPRQAVVAATAIVLLAPSLPLLFMGQEWASSSPFLFFRDLTSYPAAAHTCAASVLDWAERATGAHREWLELHRKLLRIRSDEIVPWMGESSRAGSSYEVRGERGLQVRWTTVAGALVLETNLGAAACGGFEERPPGRVLFASPAATFAAGVAPPWSVRWTLR
jgi:maltooligosyltrehalose trehalohydrolase